LEHFTFISGSCVNPLLVIDICERLGRRDPSR
jgi:hypothetical protein